MKVIVDTNVLVRALVRDDPEQARVAEKALKAASLIALPLPCLRALESGGDFADGVIAAEGLRRGGDTFITFDKKAVALLRGQGYAAQLLKTSKARPSRQT